MEMHKTNCSKCNNPCEVPFRPNGKKPVFCKDCFVRDEERAAPSFQKSRFSSDRGERSFGGDRSYNAPQASSEDPRISAIQKELKGVQAKLDTILEYLEEAA
jgi:CxxC-x17-CxxC domain-containing protein